MSTIPAVCGVLWTVAPVSAIHTLGSSKNPSLASGHHNFAEFLGLLFRIHTAEKNFYFSSSINSSIAFFTCRLKIHCTFALVVFFLPTFLSMLSWFTTIMTFDINLSFVLSFVLVVIFCSCCSFLGNCLCHIHVCGTYNTCH